MCGWLDGVGVTLGCYCRSRPLWRRRLWEGIGQPDGRQMREAESGVQAPPPL